MLFEILIFIVSILVLSWLSSSFVKTLIEIARYLRWREFIVAFFVMGFAASLPNLFVDLNAALQGLAPISFGDIIGGNLVDLTLIMAIVVFFSKGKVSTDSKMVQGSSVFTFFIAILPIFLIWKGRVTQVEGAILILAFFVYAYWLFSKDDRFKKVYRRVKEQSESAVVRRRVFAKNVVKIILIVAVLYAASQGIIYAAKSFQASLGISLSLVGVLIVALGNCFPEMYFGIVSGRKGEGWMVVGDMMGSVIVCATLVLGIIGLVAPFEIKDMSVFLIARIFTVIAALFFLIVVRTGKKITKKEALLLLFIYIIFLMTEIFVK
ncbi:MAG: sodium:calcium antiporter [Candidatus Staskawiczbacteria bacterium]|nr:sodium:calcium antiporter [Candidatus Staskawiczbacteria bacterium]